MENQATHPADAAALDRLLAVEPVWHEVERAATAVDLADHTLLHAGPRIRLDAIAQPVLNSAATAALYEGWAETHEAAEHAIRNGTIRLLPAQDHGAVVPLAAVLSPGMWVQIVIDSRNPGRRAVSPFNGGSGPAMRLGQAGPAVVAHLRWLNGPFAACVARALDRGIPLIPIADAALAAGDDCHGRTIHGTALLVERLSTRLGEDGGADKARRFLEKSPGFFLNLWMAASQCILAAGEGPGSSLVTAIGANGGEVGLRIGAMPGRWFTAPAEPPRGLLDPGITEGERLGAIGDSAVVDALGLGAMAMNHAPEQAKALGPFMPAPAEALSA
ncbi:MAG: DUF1116 domain-containing protein, partial [Roseiarcus sp.]